MADVKKIIEVEVHGEETVKDLKQNISDLRDALVNCDKDSESWKQVTEELIEKQQKLSDVMNAGKQKTEAATTSIVGMEKAYRDLYKTYSLLSEEQRNSDFGKQMGKNLSDLSEKINKSKQDVGN